MMVLLLFSVSISDVMSLDVVYPANSDVVDSLSSEEISISVV